MAKRTYRPGRNLVIFFLGVGVLFGLVAVGGNWKPELGLDLQGGTRITLIAVDNPSKTNLNEARKIIDQRVNASGVAESEVVVQGSKFIVVEIPGKTQRDLVDVVKRQAQLRFRLVAASAGAVQLVDPSADPSASPSSAPTTPAPSPGSAPSPTASPDAAKPSPSTGDRPRPVPGLVPAADEPGSGATTPAATPGKDPATGLASTKGQTLDETIAWAASPPEEYTTKFSTFLCPGPGEPPVVDNPDEPMMTCDPEGNRYLLSKAVIEGTGLSDARAEIPQNSLDYVVSIDLKDDDKITGRNPTADFAEISRQLFENGKQFAMVLDGVVLSAPVFRDGAITNGTSQIEGNFTEDSARSLASALKFGALPVAFEKDPSTETIGPSLAGDQLTTGLLAGALGLLAVMIYCVFYYRGLGLVVLASLALAAAITFAMVLLLSETAGFTLTLPGIAGLIIGVGVTADSFVIFFERIRDEMREGRSMRVAVETGWKRARQTRMAANVVSMLSAVVLYLFATGVVKGFGFALGLSTAIDLAVLFWFTKPAVSWLAKFKFFNGGGRLSGLSPETLGMDAVPAAAGGKA